MKKLIILALIIVSNIYSEQKYDWNILLYMEASVDLQKEAMQNISDIIRAGVNNNIHIGIFLHTHGADAWLFSTNGNSLIFEDYILFSADPVVNITHAAHHVFASRPAENYGVILWNHGFGILEPIYDPALNDWITLPDGNDVGACTVVPEKYSTELHVPKYKGMLCESYYKTILSNDQMVESFKIISQNILHGQKLGFITMDLCLGAMVEHGYQLKNYADHITGTQDCELSDGLDYFALVNHLKTPNLTARDIVQHIVMDYDAYYSPRAAIGRYTHAAIDLSYMDAITNNLDQIIEKILILFDSNPPAIKALLCSVRQNCLTFCVGPYYKDLHQVYELIHGALAPYHVSPELVPIKQELFGLLTIGQQLIEQSIVANVTGPVTAAACGMSIYWPGHKIDPSYPPTLFAQESQWLNLITKLLN